MQRQSNRACDKSQVVITLEIHTFYREQLARTGTRSISNPPKSVTVPHSLIRNRTGHSSRPFITEFLPEYPPLNLFDLGVVQHCAATLPGDNLQHGQ